MTNRIKSRPCLHLSGCDWLVWAGYVDFGYLTRKLTTYPEGAIVDNKKRLSTGYDRNSIWVFQVWMRMMEHLYRIKIAQEQLLQTD